MQVQPVGSVDVNSSLRELEPMIREVVDDTDLASLPDDGCRFLLCLPGVDGS